MYKVIVLFPGYSTSLAPYKMQANCTCTLIKGPINILVDTMTAWDGPKLTQALLTHNLTPDDINYVICTHGHSDHVGCNYLFQKAFHIVGFSKSKGDEYDFSVNFQKGEEFSINDQIKVVPTPGHTMQDVTVLVQTEGKVFAITGDLFEREEDEEVWREAGSDDEGLQIRNRERILQMADFIVPGHGPMFAVPAKFKLV